MSMNLRKDEHYLLSVVNSLNRPKKDLCPPTAKFHYWSRPPVHRPRSCPLVWWCTKRCWHRSRRIAWFQWLYRQTRTQQLWRGRRLAIEILVRWLACWSVSCVLKWLLRHRCRRQCNTFVSGVDRWLCNERKILVLVTQEMTARWRN